MNARGPRAVHLLVPIVLVAVLACGPGASAPVSPTSVAPPAAAQLIPGTLAGVPLVVDQWRGLRAQPGEDVTTRLEGQALRQLGIPEQRYVVAVGYSTDSRSPVFVSAFRFEGADPAAIAPAFLANLTSHHPDVTPTALTVGGRSVTFIGGSEPTCYYVAGDTV